MKVCIIGGGNIGTGAAAYFAKNGNDVRVFASRFQEFGRSIKVIDSVTDQSFEADITLASNDFETVLDGADMVLITYPSFMLDDICKRIRPFLKQETMIGIIPGSGGSEFFGKPLINDGHILFGMDRVPCIARVNQYGKSVYASKKESVRIASIPAAKKDMVCRMCGEGMGLKCVPLQNYLTVTFTPSNQIMHTARTYTMFKGYSPGAYYERNFKFYREWDDSASEVFIGMDAELQSICGAFDRLDLSGVISVREHYESYTVRAMTQKISDIMSLSKIESPMKQAHGGFIPDFESRYFTEDVPFGLCVLKGFAKIAGVNTPMMDEVLKWNQQNMEKEYFDSLGNLGVDFKETAAPQNFGVSTKKDVYQFYGGLKNEDY